MHLLAVWLLSFWFPNGVRIFTDTVELRRLKLSSAVKSENLLGRFCFLKTETHWGEAKQEHMVCTALSALCSCLLEDRQTDRLTERNSTYPVYAEKHQK